ncbi:hypothetical protein EB155_05305 [archaeon]|jgi:ABC-type transport system involved in multi-copper enzyme maturation permease subunit|nr:hypothetical protein [Asgard group archaeon]NDB29450.1 hypothetical protein [archaeon]NDB55492.1 hypothetical protein [archaeon]NDB79265.1 hypothetical protein [archaeon]
MSISNKLEDQFPVFVFNLRHSIHKKYNWILALSMFLPILAYWSSVFFTDRDLSNGLYWVRYYRIYFRVTLFYLVSFTALLVGTGMFRDLLTENTIVYLFTKPIKRNRIYFETLGAYFLISISIVTPGIITYHIFGDLVARIYDTQFTLGILQSIYNLLLELLGAYIILFGLGAVFVMTGLGLKRPLLINLLIAFGIIIEAFLLDLIANNYEPVYIASNIVSKGVIGFSNLPRVDERIYRFSLGLGYEPIDTFLNFLLVFIASLLIGHYVSKKKQLI